MKGVAAYLQGNDDGSYTLVLDDIESLPEVDGPDWIRSAPYTMKQFGRQMLRDMSLSSDQFAEIGECLVARLLASTGDRD